MPLSVITLNHQRETFLEAQINSLQKVLAQTPEIVVEHVVVNVASPGPQLPETVSNYTCVQYTTTLDNGLLNFSKARNLGATKASHDALIFLDADCVVDDNFFTEYVRCLTPDYRGIVHGHAWYMRQGVTYTQMQLERATHTQFYRPGLDVRAAQPMVLTNAYELFSSIHFGCLRSTFEIIGGFDEEYRGYSCEDTDFGQRLRKLQIPLSMNKAEAFHQYHKPSGAPFDHVAQVARNANYFASKWGWLPARGWLDAFSERGLVTLEGERVIVLAKEQK